MSMEIISIDFRKVERSYYSTPDGWRLATFDEVREGLKMIKDNEILNTWDRARLLDGWITGPGYNFEIGNDFKGCLGYMLLIRTNTSGCAYADVNISDSQKQVALLLCAEDFNYEVVYWLFNSWARNNSMDLRDVIQGRIPFTNAAKLKEMNRRVCSLARKLGDKGPVSEKVGKMRFSGKYSMEEALSDMIKIVNTENLEQYNLANLIDMDEWVNSCFPESLEPSWLEDFDKQGVENWNYIADVIWNFLSESFAGWTVQIFAMLILAQICKLNDEFDLMTSSQKNFMVASFILFYLSWYNNDIIHAPLAHDCRGNCAANMICYVGSKYGPADLQRFNQTLQMNAMWRCYDCIGNYDLLNKLLILAASGEASRQLKMEGKADVFVVNRLLEFRAQPGPAYDILGYKRLTALHAAIAFLKDEDIEKEVAESLLNKCDEKQQERLANTPQGNGYTALHIASFLGDANTCQMLLDYGAKLDVPDKDGETALHKAVERENDAVVNLLMKYPHITGLVDLRDKKGVSPLDIAVAKTDIKLVAKLISKSKQPEAYFDKMDLKQLLRYSLLDGSVNIVRNLFEKGTELPAGGCDDEGKTICHLAAMCEDERKAMEMVRTVLENIEEKEKLVAKGDKRFRTALHEAALNGNENLCRYLLDVNPNIINLKDRDGRNPIYDAVKGKQNEEYIIAMLLAEYSKKDIPLNAFIDRNGLTPLHVAASLGKKDLVKFLLSSEKNGKEYLKRKGVVSQEASEYLKRSDFLGQTALHKAANCGDSDTVEFLLKEGAHPLKERDCDGRTALHYAVQAKTGGDKIKLAKLLFKGCKTDEEKLLLLWASATGLERADHNLSKDDPLHKFLVDKKNEMTTVNLLQTAASEGDIEMTKELITRGYQIGDIDDPEWTDKLESSKQENVKRVLRQLKRIPEQENDQPTMFDKLGRIDYARGLAALFLNPYIKPPITVGISGSWGMGKSSLMVQTESILLQTAAQMALLPSATFLSSASELPKITTSELSEKGEKKYVEIKRHVDFEQKGNRSLFRTMTDKIWSWVKKSNREESRAEIGQDSLAEFLSSYQAKYRKIFKSLAAMDRSDMFTTRTREDQEPQNPHSNSMWGMVRDMVTTNYKRSKSSTQQSKVDSAVEESVPAVLTVQYNAWKYRNETEALAGMAVEITKELEEIMTEAQWLSTCWRNTWKNNKYNISIEIIYPCLLAVVLACTITWILWVILDRSDKFKDWAIPKYACLPTAIVIMGWTVTKSAMSILRPVSTQLMSYISFPDHTDKLGYQERVISDINFLKDEIGKRPYMVFKAYSWLFTVISTLWLLFFEWWVTPLFFHPRIFEKTMLIPKIALASGTNLRIIVFIDDLDRCQESVILQVLSAINLVLAVCEINVVLGIDKGLIERAIIKKYGDMKSNRSFKDNQELAEKYLQKIIQLPLDLPDPSEGQSRKFLEGQLGVFQEPSKGADSELKPDTGMAKILRQKTFRPEARRRSTFWDVPERERESEIISDPQVTIEVPERTTMAARYNRRRPIFQNFKLQLCKLFLSSASVFCGKKDETEATTSDAARTGREARQQEDETESTSSDAVSSSSGEILSAKHTVNKISNNRNYWSWIPIRESLFVRYSKGEQDAFCYFQKLATDSRKLPREWKRHLSYHRLVWNIFYLTREAKDVAGWQVQLITWIFVCWEWRENMNFVIQNWNKIGILKTSPSDKPSLQMIVDHFIELESGASHEEGSVSKDKNIEAESTKRRQEKLEELAKDDMVTEDGSPPLFQGKNKEEVRQTSFEGNIDYQERSTRAGPEKLDTPVENTLRKELDELKKEIKDLKDEFMKEIKDLKDEFMKQHNRKNEKREEEKRMKLKRWETLRSALDRYDVPMDAIQAFQRFRFYCIAGHLSWPLPEV